MSEPGSLIRSLSGRPAARNYHTFVINEIGAGIASGRFAVGAVLPNDAEMIDRYGVSRTVLREALKTLEAKGLVEARAKVGTRVLPRYRWNFFDPQVLHWMYHAGPDRAFVAGLLQVRVPLSQEMAMLAADRRSAEQVRMMHYWLQQRGLAAGAAETCALAEFELHRTVAEASGNPLLRSAMGVVEFAVMATLEARMRAGTTDFAVHAAEDYAALVRAIETGDPGAARAAMARIVAADAQSLGFGAEPDPA